MTVKSFSSQLLDIYKLGSEKEFIFDCKTIKRANSLQHRLHALRREMRKEKHWLLPVAEAVIISRRGNLIIAHPPDDDIANELAKALKEQGLKETFK